jgi:putative ATPase
MKGIGYGQGYRYVHDDPGAREEMPCLHEQFRGQNYFRGGDSQRESND